MRSSRGRLLRNFSDDHLQNCDAAIAKFKFWASRIVKLVTPIRFPRSSNKPPPEEPADSGAVIWMYSVVSPPILRPDNRPAPSVLARPFGEPIV